MASLQALFETVVTDREPAQEPKIALLMWWAARLSEQGFTPSYGPGDHGNLSCRMPDGCLITARETVKAILRPEEVMYVHGVDRTGAIPKVLSRGPRLPSTDTLLHLRIYETRPDVEAIIHGHDMQALSRFAELKLPRTSHAVPSLTVELIEEICALAHQHDYVLMRDHGFLALGRTIDAAGELFRRVARTVRSLP